jgi:8-oxo-dGTP diphosphatase
MKEDVKVGLAVIVLKGNDILLGRRIGSLGNLTWGFPGGKINYYETLGKCGIREIKEETGIKIKLIDNQAIAATEDFFMEGDHYITLYIRARYLSGTPKVMEPERCKAWAWFNWNHLPSPLFSPIKNLIKQRYNPFK